MGTKSPTFTLKHSLVLKVCTIDFLHEVQCQLVGPTACQKPTYSSMFTLRSITALHEPCFYLPQLVQGVGL
jgi:hypothetical protein